MIVIVTSGACDPIHEGHVKYLTCAADWARAQDAQALHIHVMNSDKWLARVKRREALLPQDARELVLRAIRGVDCVIVYGDDDDTVTGALARIVAEHPGVRIVFAKGGDRRVDEIPEATYCRKHGIDVVDGFGGNEKLRSSRDLARRLGL